MELEMKYRIESRDIADVIWNDDSLMSVADLSSREKLVMKAVYFDTEDRILSKNNMAFRVRLEGERIFATLKWDGHSSNGFHEREELNVPVPPTAGETYFMNPPVDLFSESDEGSALINFVGDKPLINMLETRYLRRRMRIDVNDSIMELAIDTGNIVTDMGDEPILELEIELFTGEVKDVKELGKTLSEKYNLPPENNSKLARGFALINHPNPDKQQ